VKPPLFTAKEWLQKLRDKKLLVRWFSAPEVTSYLRITIGTQAEAEALVRAVRAIFVKLGRARFKQAVILAPGFFVCGCGLGRLCHTGISR